jgi:pyruvate kinase
MSHRLAEFDLDHKPLYFRRTKIIATLGPSSDSDETITHLIKKGLDIIRINFSHGMAEDHVKLIKRIRAISKKLKIPVAVLGDLCGPKIRVGKFKNDSILLKEDSIVKITTKQILGEDGLICSQFANLTEDVFVKERILLDDGKLELKVIKKYDDIVEAKVIRGGILKNNKGMNLPDSKLKISALSDKDKSDVKYCIEAEVDYIALSFVQRPNDIKELKNLIADLHADIPIIAKIEKPEALENINEIINLADGIMIARGDLGVELPPQKVPIIQNRLIQMANEHNKPVIVATQMLESMIENSSPTRAEVTDVAGAVSAGADAVMLSGETAAGKYPKESFEIMDSIIRETETHEFFALGGAFKKYTDVNKNFVYTAIGSATALLSRDLQVRCVFVKTRSGFTARFVSSDRPAAPIIAFTESEKVQRRLKLFWGIHPMIYNPSIRFEKFILLTEKTIKGLKLAKKDDFILIISSPGGITVFDNTIMVHQIT